MKWKYNESPSGTTLTFSGDLAPKSARLFHVSAKTQDFRDSRWSFEPMERGHADGDVCLAAFLAMTRKW